jgi:hypothetical protein
MIACDECNEWFHGKCVNVTRQQASKVDRYICPTCRRKAKAIKAVKQQIEEPKIRRFVKKATSTSMEPNAPRTEEEYDPEHPEIPGFIASPDQQILCNRLLGNLQRLNRVVAGFIH